MDCSRTGVRTKPVVRGEAHVLPMRHEGVGNHAGLDAAHAIGEQHRGRFRTEQTHEHHDRWHTFDQVAYDDDADVLYLHVGDPSTATDFAESAEGHAIRLGASGRVVGLTLLRPRYHLEKGDPITVTVQASARFQIDPSVVHAA